jgi:cell division septal protein FtsQ
MTERLSDRQEWIRGRRKKRKVARLARIRRQLIRYVLLAGLVTLGVAGFTRVDWWLPNNNPEAIEVRNNKVASTEQVRAALRAYTGKPLFSLDPQKLEAQVNKLPAVKYAFVRRCLLPHPHLVVEVLEEFPWATLCTAPDVPPYAVIAQSGRIIPIKDFPAVIQPPLKFYGTGAAQFKESDVAKWADWLSLVSAQTGAAVTAVDMQKPTDISIETGDLHLKVGPADSGLTRRLGRLASVMPVLVDYRDRLEYIDLSLDNSVPLKIAKQPIKDRLDGFEADGPGSLDVSEPQNFQTESIPAIRTRHSSPLEPDSGLQVNEQALPGPLPGPLPANNEPADGRQTADSRPEPPPPI